MATKFLVKKSGVAGDTISITSIAWTKLFNLYCVIKL